MRYFFVALGLSISLQTFSQKSASFTSEALLVYSEEVQPFLMQIAKDEFLHIEDNEQVVIARYNALLVDTMVISRNVKGALMDLEEKALADKDFIATMVEQQYRLTYVGLPPKFYEGARKRLHSQ